MKNNDFTDFQKLQSSLAQKLDLPELKSGTIVIRNAKGFRENEKLVAYVWIVEMVRSIKGRVGLFTIKFNASEFRAQVNEEELIQGVFTFDREVVDQYYSRTLSDTTKDIIPTFSFNLFAANEGITLDGIGYNLKVIAPNLETCIQLNNPNTPDWKKWEQEIWTLGKELAAQSNNKQLTDLFC